MMAVAGVISAGAASSGLYPQFDNGKLRLVVGLGAGVLAALVVAVSSRIRSRIGAGACALGLAAMLGVVNTFLPAILMTVGEGGHPEGLLVALLFGVMFGAPTGIAYGIPLAVLAGLLARPLAETTLDAADRGRARASAWAIVLGTLIAMSAIQQDQPLVFVVLLLAFVVINVPPAVRGVLRVRARHDWTTRVHAGGEPRLRVRALSPEDDASSLVRFAEGATVVELLPTGDGVYRIPAAGIPLAIVADRP